MNRSYQLLLLVACVMLTTEALAVARESVIEGRAMGMAFRVVVVEPQQDAQLADVRRLVIDILDLAEATFSLYRADSEIALWNADRSTDWIAASEGLISLVEHSRVLSKATQGAFDPTVRPLTKLWGFERIDEQWSPPSAAQLAEALRFVGIHRIQLRSDPPSLKKELPEIELDLNALVEGWCLDRITASLKERIGSNFLVHLGGEYVGVGHNARGEPWAIMIESPRTEGWASQSTSTTTVWNRGSKQSKVEWYVELLDECISTSGTYRNGHVHQGKWFGHILDARTGYPLPRERLLSSVVAKSALTADAMATALLTLDVASSIQFSNERGLASLVLTDDSGHGSEHSQGRMIALSKAGEIRFRRKETGSRATTSFGVATREWFFFGLCIAAIVVAVAIFWAKRRFAVVR